MAPRTCAGRVALGEHVLHAYMRLDHCGAGIDRFAQRSERGVDRLTRGFRLVGVHQRG